MASLLYLFLSSLVLADETCLKGLEGAKNLHAQVWDLSAESKKDLTVDELNINQSRLYKITTEASCGMKGCDTSLYSENAKGCLAEALSFSGNIKPTKAKDWSSVTVTQKFLPVDKKKETITTYLFDEKEAKFKERKL